MTVMPLGRFKGTRFEDVPRSYCLWLLNQPGVRLDLRIALKRRLGMPAAPIPAVPDFKMAQAGEGEQHA